MLLRPAALLVLAAALAGCGGKSASTTTSNLPPGCSVPEVDAIVTSFLARPTLAPAAFFERYSSSESDGRAFATRSRAAALVHLEARLAAGERDRLISLRVAAQDVNHVGITFLLTRFAPDFRARGIFTRLAQGAGIVDCAHGNVAAWVMKGP